MQQKGGDKPMNVIPELVNRFTDPIMEQYMNPIYGLVYCEIGYITNIFYLEESGIENDWIPENHVSIINELCKKEGDTTIIKPTRDILNNETVTLTDIGQYIAIKYVNMLAETDKEKIAKNQNGYVAGLQYLNNKNYVKNKDLQRKMTQIHKSIKKKITKNIPFEDDDIFVFHMILYCLWWKVGNNNGFDEYYRGIQNVFDIVNECFPEKNFMLKEKPVVIPKPFVSESSSESSNDSSNDSSSNHSSSNHSSSPNGESTSSFEEILLDIAHVDFPVYVQEQSLHFCKEKSDRYYADCGETTARNIINILCYDGEKFDPQYLIEKGAIKELIEYYEVFNTFQLQSTQHARNAWSKLIIQHAQNNIKFGVYCNTEKRYGYDMDGGLTINKEKPNLLQMLQNFLQEVDTWDKLINTNITEIKSNVNTNGIGKIYIRSNLDKLFTVHLEDAHFYVSIPKKSKKKLKNYGHLEPHQKYFLDILLKTWYSSSAEENQETEKEFITYYLNFIFSSEDLVYGFNKYQKMMHLKTLFIQLSLSNKYDSDTRRRIEINTEDSFLHSFIASVNSKKLNELTAIKVNDYTFIIPNDSDSPFEFVKRIEKLNVLNYRLNNYGSKLEEIDLTPLKQIEHIGNSFLYGYVNLKEIKLEHLINVKTIGSGFLGNCQNLTKINLSSLSNVTHIGHDFLSRCQNLEQIDLSSLFNVTDIGDEFLSRCPKLKKIDLTPLKNIKRINNRFLQRTSVNEVIFPKIFEHVTYIGNSFLGGSKSLKTIDLSCFSNVTNIDSEFLFGCGIATIDLSPLTKLTSIGENFLYDCYELESITLPEIENNITIGKDFLTYSAIKTIDLSPLKKLTTIEENFLCNCNRLESITFPESIRTIKSNFLNNSDSLQTIDLSSFSNVTNIDSDFLSESAIETIDLSPLKNITDINSNFLYECENLKSITFPDIFEHVKYIGISFLSGSTSLQTIDLSCFSNVTIIGISFLNNSGIETIDLSPLKNLTINRLNAYYFLNRCKKLKSVVIPFNLKGIHFDDNVQKTYTNEPHVFTKLDTGEGKRPTRKLKRNLKRTRKLKQKTRKPTRRS